MRKREKLTPEERFALALDLIRSEHSFAEVCAHYNVSHTTAYKIRNAFLDGGRRALAGARAREAIEPIADEGGDNAVAVRDDGVAAHDNGDTARDDVVAARENAVG